MRVLRDSSLGLCLGILLFAPAAPLLQAQTASESGDDFATSDTLDCTKVSIDYLNDPNLTREERIALMDRALMKSLSEFDACQTAQSSNSGGGGGGAAGAGDGGGSGAGEGGGSGSMGGQKSFAAQDMTGTETAPADNASGANAAGSVAEAGERQGEGNSSQADEAESDSTRTETARALDNGKIPEDIPPADNDSVLEAQIRRAAINEKDPKIKKKLWNEYRKYKGLPQVM